MGESTKELTRKLMLERRTTVCLAEARIKDFLDPEYAKAYTESCAETDAELCEYIKGLKARIKKLEEALLAEARAWEVEARHPPDTKYTRKECLRRSKALRALAKEDSRG